MGCHTLLYKVEVPKIDMVMIGCVDNHVVSASQGTPQRSSAALSERCNSASLALELTRRCILDDGDAVQVPHAATRQLLYYLLSRSRLTIRQPASLTRTSGHELTCQPSSMRA